jgi:tetratricopeptide (TPR) repeat protein
VTERNRGDDGARERSARRLGALVALLAGAVAFAAFQPALRAGFLNFDDDFLYVQSAEYRGLDARRLAWMFTTTRLGHYAPLTWLTAALDFAMSGLDPRAFHRTNLILHASNAALFCLVAVRLVREAQPERADAHPFALRIASGVAAILFAVHPLRTESVAWVTERRGLLGAFFLLLALLAWLRACAPRRAELASRAWYFAALLALTASLLSKGLGMTFVATTIALDVYPLRRLPGRVSAWWKKDFRAVWLQKVPVFLLGAASAWVSAWAARSAGNTVRTLEQWGPLARVGQAGYGLLFYVQKTLWPAGLAPLHELPYRYDAVEPRFLASLVAVAVLLPILFRLRRSMPWLAAAAAGYGIALAPVLGFAQAGPQLVADRYSYVACMPWALVAGGALLLAWSRVRGTIFRAATAAVLIALSALLFALCRKQTEVWHDSRALWTRVLEAGEPSSIAHNNLGAMDGADGRYETAIEHLQAALAIRPGEGRAWFNLGLFYTAEDRLAEAERAYREARKTMTPAADPLVNLGNLYLNRLNRIDDAVAAFREAVADVESAGPRRFSPLPYLGLGVALERKGETAEARRTLEFAAQFPETRERALQALGR